jgi:hypothetical protein
MMSPEAQAQLDEIFKGYAPGYKRNFYDGWEHGFAVRGNLSNPKIKAGKEGAFEESVKWFKEYF